MVVEPQDALCLLVVVVGLVYHMTVPQRIVGDDIAARPQHRHHHVVALAVGALVAVDEGHVERHAQSRCLGQRVADDERDLVGHGRLLNPRAGKVLHLVVHLKRVEPSAVRQSLCHGYGGVAAERSHLEDGLRTYHLDQHLQQPSLQVVAGHPAVDGVDVGGPPKPVQVVGLWRGVSEDVVVERHFLSASIASR